MRRMLVLTIVAGLLTAGAASCARETEASAPPTGEASAGNWPAGVEEADVYVQVLRRYLGTWTGNSVPDRTFETVYVLDHAYPDAGDPNGKHERSTPIRPDAQDQIRAALTRVAQVAFIADGNTVIETKNGCAQVSDGGILITLGTANGDDHEVQVAVNGFAACLVTERPACADRSGQAWHGTKP